MDIAEREGAEYTVPMIANANPSGAVDQAAFDQMADSIC
jgi:microcystin degradation protein MlrC